MAQVTVPARPAKPKGASRKGILDIIGPANAVIGALGVAGLILFGWRDTSSINTILPYYVVVLFLALRYAARSKGQPGMEVIVNPPGGTA